MSDPEGVMPYLDFAFLQEDLFVPVLQDRYVKFLHLPHAYLVIDQCFSLRFYITAFLSQLHILLNQSGIVALEAL